MQPAHARPQRRTNPLPWILIGIGAVLVIIGIVYFTVKAGSLPSFMGQLKHKGRNEHRTTRGSIALGIGAALIIAGIIVELVLRRRNR
ncbi:MAG TPA: hypothetical protein VKG43_05715 [Acidimicrobiales bacterium]|nr:hypothetical protein [Acidimicrobiales bacterium]